MVVAFALSYATIDHLLQPSMSGRSLEAGLTSFLFTCAIFVSYGIGTGALHWRPLRRAASERAAWKKPTL